MADQPYTFQAPTQKIVTDTIQNPPQQFTYTIAAGQTQRVHFDHDYVRILSLSDPTGFKLRFGQSGTPTDVVGAGIGYELPVIVRSLDLINTSGTPTTITIALTIGKIFDDRLNVSGNITVQNTITTPLYTKNSGATAPFPDTAVAVSSASAAVIYLLDAASTEMTFQNLGPSDIYWGISAVVATLQTNGQRLAVGQTITIPTNTPIRATCLAGGTADVRRIRWF